ncbi:unnamed protein product [Rhizophagus irregularis]|nr:unnamed protein product [Rhizophagus irregularis]
MVNKDKSGKLQPQLIQEKLRIWINKFRYDPEDVNDGKEEQDKLNKIKNQNVLDNIVPLEITNMITENIKEKLNREFTWPEGETIEDPIFERNEFQKVNSFDNGIIELQSYIAKLENERNQLNEGLRGQLEN